MVMMILSQIAIVQGNKVGIKATEAGFYRMSDPSRFERQDIEKYWSLRRKVSVAAGYSNGLFGVYDVEAAVSPSKQLIGPFIGQGEMEVELWVGLYSSNSNKNMPVFSINSQTGQIKTSGRGSLDFEMISLYTIEVTAFDDGEKFYGGTMNKTINGFTCQNWMSSEPRDQPYAAAMLKGDKTWENVLGNHNFCRNPDGGKPWCYINSHRSISAKKIQFDLKN